MYNVKKDIENLDNLCIPHEEKEKRIKEFEQLNNSIAYSSTVLHFFWNQDTMISYVRDQRYTIKDMLGNDYYMSRDCKTIKSNFQTFYFISC